MSKTFKCSACEKVVSSSDALFHHQISKHPDYVISKSKEPRSRRLTAAGERQQQREWSAVLSQELPTEVLSAWHY